MTKACKLGGAKPENICAFCGYHKRPLTKNQMRQRECLKKQCPRLVPKLEHPYWAQREQQKQLRKERKERMNERLQGVNQ